jgi:hypothetical protein
MWPRGEAAAARCAHPPPRWNPGVPGGHPAPHGPCTCGIHASASVDALLAVIAGGRVGVAGIGLVLGEVDLWGVVVKTGHGWRSEFARPRRLVVPVAHASSRGLHGAREIARDLAAYGVDVVVAGTPAIARPGLPGRRAAARSVEPLRATLTAWLDEPALPAAGARPVTTRSAVPVRT